MSTPFSLGSMPSQMVLSKRQAGLYTLEDLLAPVTLNDFREKHWERDPLYIPRHDSSFYEDIFSLADVDRYIFSNQRDSRAVLTVIAPPDRGQKPVRHRISEITMDGLYNAFTSGDTIRLDNVQESWPPLAVLIASLEDGLNAKLNVNFYMTPADSQGFSVHYDTHDTFILQVDGAKEWYLYEPDVHLPVETPIYLKSLREPAGSSIAESSARLVRKVRLEKGDLLYVPRGVPHKAVAVGAPSLHLTLGIHPIYWVELLKLAIERTCVDEPALRRSLDPGFLSDPAVQDRMRETFDSLLRTACASASFDETMTVLKRDIINSGKLPPDGHFAELVRASELAVDDVVRRRAGLRCATEHDGTGAAIQFGMGSMRGPASILPALEYIQDHPQFRVGDLPGLSDNSRLVLVRRLIREGLLARLGPATAGSTDPVKG